MPTAEELFGMKMDILNIHTQANTHREPQGFMTDTIFEIWDEI